MVVVLDFVVVQLVVGVVLLEVDDNVVVGGVGVGLTFPSVTPIMAMIPTMLITTKKAIKGLRLREDSLNHLSSTCSPTSGVSSSIR